MTSFKFNPSHIEQHTHHSHEHHGNDGAGQVRKCWPREPAELVEVPGKRERDRGLGLEQPAGRLCFGYRDARRKESEMCRCYPCQYESEQDKWVSKTAQPEIQRDRNRCRRWVTSRSW